MQTELDLDLFSGKTSQESCPTRPTHSDASSPDWWEALIRLCPVEADGQTRALCLDRSDSALGGFWTRSFSGLPREGAEYGYSRATLSGVLETGDVPERYFLSATACAGILRRAERRGKKLPAHLEAALETGAGVTT